VATLEARGGEAMAVMGAMAPAIDADERSRRRRRRRWWPDTLDDSEILIRSPAAGAQHGIASCIRSSPCSNSHGGGEHFHSTTRRGTGFHSNGGHVSTLRATARPLGCEIRR